MDNFTKSSSTNVINYNYPILLVFDKYYAEYVIVLISSIIKKTNHEQVFFHLITDEVTNFSFQESYLNSKNLKYRLYRVDINKYKNFPQSGHITKGAYYLLNAMELIQENNKFLLYLDIDIYVNDDISKVFSYYDDRYSLNCIASDETNYFGSGFLLINIDRSKDRFTMDNFSKILLNNKEIKWHDQDILNLTFADDSTKNIPYIWDFAVIYYLMYKKSFHKRNIKLANAKSIHFPGTTKPWRFSTILPYAKEWRDIYFEIYKKNPWDTITIKEFTLRIIYFIFPNPKFLLLINKILRGLAERIS
jgi:UDP-glucose:(galactosyl)LPS alpha-1,2-glucosyltransferase